jgi:hypothetical protein
MENYSGEPRTPGQRAAVYWFIDGLPLVVSGSLFVIWGVLGIWGTLQPRMRGLAGLFGFTVVFFGAVCPGFDRFITEFLKARVTYPRTGYVRRPVDVEEKALIPGNARGLEPLGEPFETSLKLRERPVPEENMTFFRGRTLMVLFAAAVTAQMVKDFGDPIDKPWGLPLLLGVTALTLYALNRDYEPHYRWWSLLILPAAALFLSPLEIRTGIRQQLVPLIPGLWLTAEGAWTLAGYLRRNPRPLAESEARV